MREAIASYNGSTCMGIKFSRVFAVIGLLLLWTTGGNAVEHPGTLPKDADCSSCHADKVSGTSVHTVMAASCTICHVSRTQGDMTTMVLSMAKGRICFACHEESAELVQHRPAVKGQCMDCHDAHSSNRPMLLREVQNTHPLALKKR